MSWGVDTFAKRKHWMLEFVHLPTAKVTGVIQFQAMVTQFKDDYESEWNSESVYGRMDPIETFQRTKRKITLAWDVVARDTAEAKFNMWKVSTLLKFLYPVYEGTSVGSLAAPPLFKFRFMNFVQNSSTGVNKPPTSLSETISTGLLGRVNGFAFEPDLDSGFFDSTAGIVYPQYIKMNCTYTVFHEHNLGWDMNGSPRKGFGNFPYGTKRSGGRGNQTIMPGPHTPPSTDPNFDQDGKKKPDQTGFGGPGTPIPVANSPTEFVGQAKSYFGDDTEMEIEKELQQQEAEERKNSDNVEAANEEVMGGPVLGPRK